MTKRNNQPPQLTQEQVILLAGAIKNGKDIKCTCGGDIFAQGSKLKLLSKLLLGTKEDELWPTPTMYCIVCNKELNLDAPEPPKDEIVLNLDLKKND